MHISTKKSIYSRILLKISSRGFSDVTAIPQSPLNQAADYQEALRYIQAKDYKNSLTHLFRTRDILDNAKQQKSMEYFYVSNKSTYQDCQG